MSLRRFYIPPDMVQHPQPEISGSEACHICRVLRMSAGDVVELFDGIGNCYQAKIVSASSERIVFSIEESFDLLSESSVHITVAQGFLKDRKMDDLIRPLTELGITCWMPFYAARSIPLPGKKGVGKRLDRWERIALEAVKQCRRGRIPRITPMETFDDILEASTDCDLKILFWEGVSQVFDIPCSDFQKPKKIMAVVGPEGGFTSNEVRLAKTHGFLTAGLGPRILKAQTATLTACALIQYCFGDMGPT